jgi:hypothetical protein
MVNYFNDLKEEPTTATILSHNKEYFEREIIKELTIIQELRDID